MIRAILFDVDGVLVDSVDANLKFYERLVARHGYTTTPQQLEGCRHLSLRDAIAFLTGAKDQIVQDIYKAGVTLADYPAEMIRYPAGYREVLDKLKSMYALAVVTARPGWALSHFIASSGLVEVFDAHVAYEDYTHPKPDPEPLMVAFDRLGITPDEGIYVGDTEADRISADAAGCKFIAFGSHVPSASDSASTFHELLNRIESSGTGVVT